MLGAIAIGVAIISLAKRGLPWARKRRSPFTSQFLRSPGQSVWNQLDDLRTDLMSYLMGLAYVPIAILSIPLVQTAISRNSQSFSNLFVYAVSGTVIFSYFLVKLFRTTHEMQKVRLGYEGEVAVGQELNQLMIHGFRVFHDFPADGFNIDHVVVGRTGVFAVETKARGKPDSGDRKQDAHVEFTGTMLRFPHWSESKPVEQSRKQAQWLSRWLGSAVGESVNVISALAIPGWYIEQTGKSDVLAYNGKRPDVVFPKYSGKQISDQMIKRISHQLEAKCRNIDPRAYTEDKQRTS
jgi:hypothetical protein